MMVTEDKMSKNFIDRKYTNILYGIALVLMFSHHFFTFPTWYQEGISYPNLTLFAKYMNAPLSICVPMFCFLSGYFYYFNKEKTYRYAFKKISNIWISYLLCFFLLYIVSIATGSINFSFTNFLLECFLLKNSNMTFCWYVSFYILMMLILPLYSRLSDKSSFLALAAALFFSYMMIVAADRSDTMSNVILKTAYNNLCNLKYFACVAMGYLFAQRELFKELDQYMYIRHSAIRIIVYFLFCLFPFLFRYLTTYLDFIGTPLFLFGLVKLIDMFYRRKLFFPLSEIGKYTLYMWFVHCAFFNVSAKYTQPILYSPRNPILVLIWGLLLCYFPSIIIRKVICLSVDRKNNESI